MGKRMTTKVMDARLQQVAREFVDAFLESEGNPQLLMLSKGALVGVRCCAAALGLTELVEEVELNMASVEQYYLDKAAAQKEPQLTVPKKALLGPDGRPLN